MPQDYVPMPPLRWRLFMYILIDVGYLGQILTIKRPKYPMYLAELPSPLSFNQENSHFID